MSKYPYHDEEWLLEALGEMSIEEIADECGVKAETIDKWVDKHGIVHEQETPLEEDGDEDSELTRGVAEGEEVEREVIETKDVEQEPAVVSEEDVHSDDEGDANTVETESEPVVAHPSTESFPDEIELLGVGRCQNCGHEDMLGAHTIQAEDEVSVCARCDKYLRGKTINTKHTILNNPRIPYWSDN